MLCFYNFLKLHLYNNHRLGFYIQRSDMSDTTFTIVYFLSLDILYLLKKRTHSIIECPMSNFDRSGHKKNLEN